MKQEINKEDKIVWVVLCITLLIFMVSFTSCGSPKYGKEEVTISSEFKWEYVACKMGRDTVVINLDNGGTLTINPNPNGEVEIIANHTRESIYLDRYYGSIFVHKYLRQPYLSFEEIANYVFDLAYEENTKTI
jgi:hypothetical protein